LFFLNRGIFLRSEGTRINIPGNNSAINIKEIECARKIIKSLTATLNWGSIKKHTNVVKAANITYKILMIRIISFEDSFFGEEVGSGLLAF
jgi:hypothetical protein